jgi:hypothetical protein
MGTRAKTATYRVVDSMDSEDENDDFGIRDRYVSQRKKSRDFKNKNIVRPAAYDGKGPWIYYKRLYLVVSLRGQAQGVLGQDYKELVKSLEERFSRRIRLSCIELSCGNEDKRPLKHYQNWDKMFGD